MPNLGVRAPRAALSASIGDFDISEVISLSDDGASVRCQAIIFPVFLRKCCKLQYQI